MTTQLAEARESLWWVVASPLVWAAHFLLCYCTAAIWCAKFAGAERSLSGARVAIAAYTVLALVAVTALAVKGLRRHRLPGGEVPHDADEPEDRHRFLGFAALLLSLLSMLAIAYSALAAAFIGSCH
jgi:uncharacterized membrane protein YhaH (DUF805 family)